MTAQKESLSFILILILGGITAISPLATDMYLPAIPTIAKELSASTSSIQTTLTVYTASFAFGQLIYGPISDSYGRRTLIIGGLLGYLFFSLCITFCQSFETLFAFRALQGFSGAAATIVIQALVRDLFRAEEFARTMSFIMLVMTMAPLCAPIIGGYIAEWFDWRMIFVVMAIFSLILIFCVLIRIPETLATERRARLHIRSIFRNYWQITKNPAAIGDILIGAFSFSGLFCFITVGSAVYIDYFGIKQENFGYFFGLNVITLFLMTFFQGQYVRRLGLNRMLSIGVAILVISAIAMVLLLVLNAGFWGIVIPMMFYIGSNTLIAGNSIARMLDNYPHLAGTASSLSGFIRFELAAVIGSLLALFSDYLAKSDRLVPNDPWPMVGTMFICALACFISYLWVNNDMKKKGKLKKETPI